MSGTIHLKKWLEGQTSAAAKLGYGILHIDHNGRLRIMNDNGSYTSFAVETVNGMTGDVVIDLASLGGMTVEQALELIADNPGPPGEPGADAYEVAVAAGFTGTVLEWLESLNGKDAYEVALEAGYVGTVEQWLADLKGDPGQDGNDGAAGLSAYQIAVNEGFVGDESAWLASLKGEPGQDGNDGQDGENGADGLSAYEVAVANGFVGTELEWLDSLKASGTNIGQDETPPEGPNDKLWFDPNELRLKVRYTDADSTQWVDANPAGLEGGGSGSGGLNPAPVQYSGSVLQALDPSAGEGDCAWSPLWELTETNIYGGNNTASQIDGSYLLFNGADSGEYGTRIFKCLVYVHSDTSLSINSSLRVRNAYTEDTRDNYGYLSLHDAEIMKEDGSFIKKCFKHNAHQKAYLYDYMDTVSDPNANDNVYEEHVLMTAALTVGTYLVKINVDFSNDVALYINDVLFLSAAGGSATMTVVSETGQAHRAPVRF